MFDDVAMEHPVAGIVGDEGDLDALLRCDEYRVSPFDRSYREAIPRHDAERKVGS